MDLALAFRAVCALIVVLGLVGLCAWAARRWPQVMHKSQRNGPPKRLLLSERLILDPRRQIVVVRDGRREHVLLLGATGEHVIESRDFIRSMPRPGDGGVPVALRPTPVP